MDPVIFTSLADVAASHDGVLTRTQLCDAGLSPGQVRHCAEVGWLRRVAPRTFVVAGAPSTHRQELRIGLSALGERSWVSYEAAASLHGLDRSRADAVEFTVERGRSTRTVRYTVHTTAMLEPHDVVTIDGLRATSATRTVIDLAHARAPRGRVEAAMDSAIRLGLSHPEVIAQRLETLRGSGRWGCRLVDRLLPDSGGHSPIERRFLELVSNAGIARPETQVVFRDRSGRHIARVDFLFRERCVIVEVTGRLGHVSDAERSRDAQRRNELQALGMSVVEYTSTQLRETPATVLRDLATHLHE